MDMCPQSWPSRLLSVPALAWVGRNLSYGMSLWHHPVVRLLSDLGVDGDWLLPAGVTAAVAAALVSYVLVERPLLRRDRFRRLRVRRPVVAAARSPVA